MGLSGTIELFVYLATAGLKTAVNLVNRGNTLKDLGLRERAKRDFDEAIHNNTQFALAYSDLPLQTRR